MKATSTGGFKRGLTRQRLLAALHKVRASIAFPDVPMFKIHLHCLAGNCICRPCHRESGCTVNYSNKPESEYGMAYY